MTLRISIVRLDGDGRIRETLEVLTETDSLAGFESTRRTLWSSSTARRLGATILPRLATDDLLVAGPELAQLRAECERLAGHVDELAAASGVRADYVVHRLRNVLGAVDRAEALGAAVEVA